MRGRSRHILGVATAVLLLTGIGALQHVRWQARFGDQRNDVAQQARIEAQTTESQVQLLQVLPSLGFRNLIADWAFLQFIQYFGNREHRVITGYGLSDNFFEAIIGLDPYAYEPYFFLSGAVSLHAGQPDRAVELMERGLQYLSPEISPNAHYIWRHKGIDEMLFLGDYEAARRSHEIAAEWAGRSSAPGSDAAQKVFQDTAEFLRTDPENERIQVNAWLQVVAFASDDETRRIAINNIEQLGYELVQLENGGFTTRPKSPDATGAS